MFQFYIMGRVGGVAKNILRLRELVTIMSKQEPSYLQKVLCNLPRP